MCVESLLQPRPAEAERDQSGLAAAQEGARERLMGKAIELRTDLADLRNDQLLVL